MSQRGRSLNEGERSYLAAFDHHARTRTTQSQVECQLAFNALGMTHGRGSDIDHVLYGMGRALQRSIPEEDCHDEERSVHDPVHWGRDTYRK